MDSTVAGSSDPPLARPGKPHCASEAVPLLSILQMCTNIKFNLIFIRKKAAADGLRFTNCAFSSTCLLASLKITPFYSPSSFADLAKLSMMAQRSAGLIVKRKRIELSVNPRECGAHVCVRTAAETHLPAVSKMDDKQEERLNGECDWPSKGLILWLRLTS